MDTGVVESVPGEVSRVSGSYGSYLGFPVRSTSRSTSRTGSVLTCVFSSQKVWSAVRATAATPTLGKIPSPLWNTVLSGINPWAVRDNALTKTSPFIDRARGWNKLPAWEGRVLEWCLQLREFSVPPQVEPVSLLSDSLGALLHSLWNPKDRRKLKMCNLTKRAVMIFTVRLKSARFHRCESADASQASSNILQHPPASSNILQHPCGSGVHQGFCFTFVEIGLQIIIVNTNVSFSFSSLLWFCVTLK